jgi:glycosyltransferase involved in cell wall biosynthesis
MYALAHKIVSSRVDGIIAQTSLAKVVYAQKYNCPIVVIPNFLREITWYPDHKKEKVIVNMGRLVNEKGQHFLLQAFAKLDQTDWKLWFVGEGPLREKLENLSHELKISEQVVFWGFKKDVDYYLLDGRVIVVDEKKFKTINVNNIVWDMLDNYLGLKTRETQQVIKKWLKDSYGIETHMKDGNLRIYRYDR